MALIEKKVKAHKEYVEARQQVEKNYTNENWRAFCIAKRNCMLLGVRI